MQLKAVVDSFTNVFGSCFLRLFLYLCAISFCALTINSPCAALCFLSIAQRNLSSISTPIIVIFFCPHPWQSDKCVSQHYLTILKNLKTSQHLCHMSISKGFAGTVLWKFNCKLEERWKWEGGGGGGWWCCAHTVRPSRVCATFYDVLKLRWPVCKFDINCT